MGLWVNGFMGFLAYGFMGYRCVSNSLYERGALRQPIF